MFSRRPVYKTAGGAEPTFSPADNEMEYGVSQHIFVGSLVYPAEVFRFRLHLFISLIQRTVVRTTIMTGARAYRLRVKQKFPRKDGGIGF